jgi:hypothetical protein
MYSAQDLAAVVYSDDDTEQTELRGLQPLGGKEEEGQGLVVEELANETPPLPPDSNPSIPPTSLPLSGSMMATNSRTHVGRSKGNWPKPPHSFPFASEALYPFHPQGPRQVGLELGVPLSVKEVQGEWALVEVLSIRGAMSFHGTKKSAGWVPYANLRPPLP